MCKINVLDFCIKYRFWRPTIFFMVKNILLKNNRKRFIFR